MKKLFFIILVTLFIISCEKEIDTPGTFLASQGTYVGVVHIAYGDVDGDDVNYIVYRLNEDNAQWEEICWTESTNWDDQGYLLSNGILPGKEYKYKMRTHSNKTSYSKYSSEISGHAFEALPVEISSAIRTMDGDRLNITVSWEDKNDIAELKNLINAEYEIQRSDKGQYSNFETIFTESKSTNELLDKGTQFSYIDESYDLSVDKEYSYRIVTSYRYSFTQSTGEYSEGGIYEFDGSAANDTTGNSGGGGNPEITYTSTDLGQVEGSSSGVILDVEEKQINNIVYMGAIKDGSIYGTPTLYQLNGSSWQQVWSFVPNVEFAEINFAVSGTNSYLAGVRDSLCVYKWNGSSWSSNLGADNLGQSDGPSDIAIEVFNSELYMAIKQDPDYDLQVLKYNGATWDTIGGDGNGIIASGNVYDIELENLNGTLYLHYRIDDVFYIKHLNGTAWVDDLQWSQEWLSWIDLVKVGSDLYFSAHSASGTYDGGVYKVTSSSTVENLIPEDAEQWFTLGAFALTSDSEGNLIVASMRAEYTDATQTELITFPHLNLYDGTSWKAISGDFTGGVYPVDVCALGTDIIYVFGDKSTANASNHPSAILSTKYSK